MPQMVPPLTTKFPPSEKELLFDVAVFPVTLLSVNRPSWTNEEPPMNTTLPVVPCVQVPSLVNVVMALFPMVRAVDVSTLNVPVGLLMKETALRSDPLALAGTSKVPALVNVVAAVLALKWPKSRMMAPLLVTLVVVSSVAPPSTLIVYAAGTVPTSELVLALASIWSVGPEPQAGPAGGLEPKINVPVPELPPRRLGAVPQMVPPSMVRFPPSEKELLFDVAVFPVVLRSVNWALEPLWTNEDAPLTMESAADVPSVHVPWLVTVETVELAMVRAVDVSTLNVPVGLLMKETALRSDPLALAGTSKVPALVNVVAAVLALKWPKSRMMAPLLVTLVVVSSVAPPSTLIVYAAGTVPTSELVLALASIWSVGPEPQAGPAGGLEPKINVPVPELPRGGWVRCRRWCRRRW